MFPPTISLQSDYTVLGVTLFALSFRASFSDFSWPVVVPQPPLLGLSTPSHHLLCRLSILVSPHIPALLPHTPTSHPARFNYHRPPWVVVTDTIISRPPLCARPPPHGLSLPPGHHLVFSWRGEGQDLAGCFSKRHQ